MPRTSIAAKGAHALKSDCTQPFYSNWYYFFTDLQMYTIMSRPKYVYRIKRKREKLIHLFWKTMDLTDLREYFGLGWLLLHLNSQLALLLALVSGQHNDIFLMEMKYKLLKIFFILAV